MVCLTNWENDDDQENDGEGDQGVEQVVNGHGKCNMLQKQRDLETLVNGLSDQLENRDDENDGEGDQVVEQVVNGHGKCNMLQKQRDL